MRSTTFLSIIVLGIIFSSCNKDEPIVRPANLHQNPTNYLLKKQVLNHPDATKGHTALYFYNQQHLVSQIKAVFWNNFRVDNNPPSAWSDTTYYFFEYAKSLPIKVTIKNEAGDQWYIKYEYQNNVIVKRTKYYSNNSVEKYTSYRYNPSGQLIEMIDSTETGVNRKYVLEYEGENVKSFTTYMFAFPPQKSKAKYPSYDNKIHFLRAVNGLPSTIKWDNFLSSDDSGAIHNYQTIVFYQAVPINQEFGSPVTSTFSYLYNDEDLPTSMSSAGWITSFEYEKYK